MARIDVKYAILENNGDELAYMTERTPDAQEIALQAAGVSADNVKEGLEELVNEFNYKKINLGKYVRIKAEQQMRTYGELDIRGELAVNGDAIIKRS
jgi:hypothetical protein